MLDREGKGNSGKCSLEKAKKEERHTVTHMTRSNRLKI